MRSDGTAVIGSIYTLDFGPEYVWKAEVTRYALDVEFELLMTDANKDWIGTSVGFRLEPREDVTWVRFYHKDWPAPNEHFRISSNCWALYLRVLRRHLEYSESVPYEDRLEV